MIGFVLCDSGNHFVIAVIVKSVMNFRNLHMVENIHVFLDVSIDDVKCGRVVVELFKNHVPKTVENFRALCTGEKGIGGLKVPLHYKNSIFHKAVPECIVQGGDITNNDGTGGESIYGPYFQDENLELAHVEEGLLSMANCGMPNTNNSQFCITLGPAQHLDGSYVVFGHVVKGFNIINNISYQPLGLNDKPVPVCKIWNCGELKPGQDWGYCENDYSDVYPPYPQDWECDLSTLQASDIVEVVTNIKDAGNQLFKDGDTVYSHQKYKKALRYLDWHLENHVGDQDELTETKTQCHLNASLTSTKLHLYRESIYHCNKIPDIESNVKALFRRAIAKTGLNDHHDALTDLDAALRLAPDNKSVLAEKARINQFLSNYQQSERLRCLQMFRT